VVSVNLNNRKWKHIIWLPGICLLVFGLPFISFKILKINFDIFNLVFLVTGIAFLTFYVKRTSLRMGLALNSGWALGTILALFIGLGLLSYTFTIKSGLIAPEFNSNIFVIFWRGIVFGLVGTALISAFPFVAVWRAFAGAEPGKLRKLGILVIALFAISLTSLSYNIGMSGFNKNKISHNVKMSLLTAIPTLLSGNPIASPVAGAFLRAGESMFSESKSVAAIDIKLAAKNPGGSD
jgi:hypothetical protein